MDWSESIPVTFDSSTLNTTLFNKGLNSALRQEENYILKAGSWQNNTGKFAMINYPRGFPVYLLLITLEPQQFCYLLFISRCNFCKSLLCYVLYCQTGLNGFQRTCMVNMLLPDCFDGKRSRRDQDTDQLAVNLVICCTFHFFFETKYRYIKGLKLDAWLLLLIIVLIVLTSCRLAVKWLTVGFLC